MKAVYIKDGEKEVVTLNAEGPRERLKEMRQLVGCETLEATFISPEYVGWVDEEGLLKKDPVIRTVAYVFNNQVVYANEIAGNILITGHNDSGEMLGLTMDQQIDIFDNFRIIEK